MNILEIVQKVILIKSNIPHIDATQAKYPPMKADRQINRQIMIAMTNALEQVDIACPEDLVDRICNIRTDIIIGTAIILANTSIVGFQFAGSDIM